MREIERKRTDERTREWLGRFSGPRDGSEYMAIVRFRREMGLPFVERRSWARGNLVTTKEMVLNQ